MAAARRAPARAPRWPTSPRRRRHLRCRALARSWPPRPAPRAATRTTRLGATGAAPPTRARARAAPRSPPRAAAAALGRALPREPRPRRQGWSGPREGGLPAAAAPILAPRRLAAVRRSPLLSRRAAWRCRSRRSGATRSSSCLRSCCRRRPGQSWGTLARSPRRAAASEGQPAARAPPRRPSCAGRPPRSQTRTTGRPSARGAL
mmetsp:Transcript_74416/g.201287  ORF Transcript_74416/g.201287 Transcript_74416/m.201287 type:complete len:205 (+) Transcript_74416:301-915(+)